MIGSDVYQSIADWSVLITVALIGLIGVLLGLILRTQHRNAKTGRATLRQVENSHPTNLRDDLDEKFDGLANLVKGAVDDIAEVKADVSSVRADVGGIKADIRQIHSDQTADRGVAAAAVKAAADTARLALERTRPGPPKPIRRPKGTS